jgi:integrase
MVKSREDFTPDLTPPNSIRELIEMELHVQTTTDKQGEKHFLPNTDGDLDDLMKRVFARIEQKALEVYKSAEPWALRAWALANLLQDEVVADETIQIADNLVAPVKDWQDKEEFDPLTFYRKRLNTLGLKPNTIKLYMCTAARVVGKFGRKRFYNDEELAEYQDWAAAHFTATSSYVHECARLTQFIRNLPGANRHRELPLKVPKMPDKFYQPTLTDHEVEYIIWSAALDNLPPSIVVRLVVASIYGARRIELSKLSSKDIHLNGKESYLYIHTAKGGDKRKQPIPECLIPLFDIPIKPIGFSMLEYWFRKVIEKACIPWRHRLGWHALRRNVVTLLDRQGSQSDIAISKFMRWSTPRELGMLDRYRQTPAEESDRVILENHPTVKAWEYALPFICEFNQHYRNSGTSLRYM